ncbi:MAG: hypothetical protein ACFFD2_04260 [Promethearchaeota archaeon]
MSDTEQILWQGIESPEYKFPFILALFGILVCTPSLIIVCILYSSNKETLFVQFLFYFSIGLFCLLIIIAILVILKSFSKLPWDRYCVTSRKLIRKGRTLWGTIKIKTLNVNEIQQIYFSKLERWFEFYTEKFNEWSKSENLSKLTFYNVNTPHELLKVLQILIPLKKHSTLENVYERIE